MRIPDKVGPGEEAGPVEIEVWLRKMVRWRLLKKRYEIRNGYGDWVYQDTLLSTWIVMPLLSLLTELGLLPAQGESKEC